MKSQIELANLNILIKGAMEFIISGPITKLPKPKFT